MTTVSTTRSRSFSKSTSSSSGRAGSRSIRAKYDSAVTNADNQRHWANADPLSPVASNSSVVRKTLRNRSRYEVANNCYARGLVNTLANDSVGTGPRLQMKLADRKLNKLIETEFGNWTKEIGLAEKLRTMRKAKAVDGEAFALLQTNEGLSSRVKLDLKLVEADQVTTSHGEVFGSGLDGIELDAYGNVSKYYVLPEHPGSTAFETFKNDPKPYDSRVVIHWFRSDRPGQLRGIPEITPALPLFAQLRRFTLAVIAAAETAADFAAFLKSQFPSAEDNEGPDAFEQFPIESRLLTTLPYGMDVVQMRAEQPTTTYPQFKREIINEIGRCLDVPLNVMLGNSEGYNYASGRLDFQTYFKSIRVEQAHCTAVVLDRIFLAWLDEALLIEGYLPEGITPLEGSPWGWFFDGTEHVDPAKEANAQKTRLDINTTNLANEWARQGKDWEEELVQRAKEIKLMKELGLTTDQAKPTSKPEPELVDDDQEEEDAETTAA